MNVSYDDLVALTNHIANDGDEITRAAIDLHHWGPNREGTAVEMFVRGDAAPAQEYMDAAYGKGKVIVHHTDKPLPERC